MSGNLATIREKAQSQGKFRERSGNLCSRGKFDCGSATK